MQDTDSNGADADFPTEATSAKAGGGWRKLAVFVIVAAAFGLLYYNFRDQLELGAVVKHEAALRAFGAESPIMVVAAAFVIYVAVTGLSLPGAAVLTLTIGWFFKLLFGDLYGFLIALVVVSFASTSGATVAFLLSRYLLRETIQNRFGDRLQKFNDALEREGAFYLFTLRLIPAVPFFVINVVMGLTPIRVWTFWWVSQIGMLPGTVVFVYTGSSVPTLEKLVEEGAAGILTPQMMTAFALLGLFPLIAKTLMARLRPSTPESVD